MVDLDDMASFIRLKYPVITKDKETWERATEYPEEVLSKWIWRCAEYLEPFADGHKEEMKMIELCKKAKRKGFSKPSVRLNLEIGDAWRAVHTKYSNAKAARAAYTFYNCAYCMKVNVIASGIQSNKDEVDLFLRFLLEELCKYESHKYVDYDPTQESHL